MSVFVGSVQTGGISFSGKTLNVTGDAQVRFGLACQPRNCYLLPVNGLRVSVPSPVGEGATSEASDG